MKLRLREIRKAANFTQTDLARKIGVDLKTVSNWEIGNTVPNCEQLWNCATTLGCTPNDILGWYENHEHESALEDPFERELIGCYRESTTARKGRILETARDAAVVSKEEPERAAYEPGRREAM
ncbi:MAG: helix-turn-helix transcriptional regulator [Raoultibacter sp.]